MVLELEFLRTFYKILVVCRFVSITLISRVLLLMVLQI